MALLIVSGVKLEASSIESAIATPSVSYAVGSVYSRNLAMFYKNDYFTVSYVNKSGEPMKFEIRAADGTRVYKNEMMETGIFHNRLLVSALPEGNYFATIYIGEKSYTTSFSIALK